jgi:hypothetical protein
MSFRARIFRKILAYIDKDDWKDYGDFIVFGEEAFQAMGTQPNTHKERRDKKVSEEIDSFAAEVTRQQGSSLAAERTTMDGARPVDLDSVLKGSSPEAQRIIQDAAEIILKEQKAVSARVAEKDSHGVALDKLDGYYAEEVISKLERIVRLVATFDAVEADRPPVPTVAEYFREVHSCFLYGFPVACAVLCRALLEDALKARYEQQKQGTLWTRSKDLPLKERKRSRILNWLDRALREKILDGSRVEAGENVKDGGDAAIHRLDDFKTQWARDEQLRLLIDDTRKVLEDLHRATEST